MCLNSDFFSQGIPVTLGISARVLKEWIEYVKNGMREQDAPGGRESSDLMCRRWGTMSK